MPSVYVYARHTISYVHRVLGSYPSNHLLQRVVTMGGSTTCVSTMRSSVYIGPPQQIIMNIRRMAGGAKRAACGNCGEYAAVAFDYLMLTHCPFSIEYAGYTRPGDHAFVIINRPSDSIPNNPATWSADTLVCDAWAGIVVSPSAYWSAMPSFPHAVHSPEIYVRYPILGDYPRVPSNIRAA